GWRTWFVLAARRVIRWVPPGGVAIFFQSDVRHCNAWVDKGYLVLRAAEEESAFVVWHKIVCHQAPGYVDYGRAGYAHMICISPTPPRAPRHVSPDVLPDAGRKPYSKAMGVNACVLACRHLREETETRIVVDPFCGRGTVLAVANALGFAAV